MIDPKWFDGFLTGAIFAVAWGAVAFLVVVSRRHRRRMAELDVEDRLEVALALERGAKMNPVGFCPMCGKKL